jgi:cytochrome c oxidase subunit II
MNRQFPLFPEAASTVANDVDLLFIVWSVVSAFFTVLIAGLILYFMARYRRRHPEEVGATERAAMWLEVGWSIIPLVIMLFMFVWGTKVFFNIYRPPADAVRYSGVGKQWMWKFQHPTGQREINTLHVPVGLPIRMDLQSEDVIHSFFVPAFRVKQDAVPGRVTSVWFQATKPGVYHLFCAEYCGGEHSKMVGSVVVLEPREYENWLAGATTGQTMAESGAALFNSLACVTCHRAGTAAGTPGAIARGPNLEGVYGNQVRLADGRTVIADDEYIRESILNPQAKITAGWEPVMPTFQGQLTEEQLSQLIAYVRSLGGTGSAEAGGTGGPASGAADTAGGQMDAPTSQTPGDSPGPVGSTEGPPRSSGGAGGAGGSDGSVGSDGSR